MDLHPSEHVIYEGRPSWRSILRFYLGGLVAAAAAGAIAALADTTGLGVAVAAAVFAAVLVVGWIRRLATRYVVTNERLHIRHGLVSRHTQETRLERLQNVNTDQGLFDRLLHIGTVDFDTAGGDDFDFAFRGVAEPEEVGRSVDRAVRERAGGPDPIPPAL
jgi:uncharacterized membrane protein YdbT with pleckstrin-like domain